MENYTAERYLEEAYAIILEKQSTKHKVVDPVLLTCMKAYALQEVKKHLEIAAEKAIFKYSGIQDGGIRVITPFIDKESITNIKIELT